MLCSRPRPLNAIAPVPGLPNAQRERPSRVAGSFFGQLRTCRPPICFNIPDGSEAAQGAARKGSVLRAIKPCDTYVAEVPNTMGPHHQANMQAHLDA